MLGHDRAIGPAPSAQVRDTIIKILGEVKGGESGVAPDGAEVFAALDSLQMITAIIRLEAAFGIVIGEDPFELERIRTFGGLFELVSEKVQALRGSGTAAPAAT